ncbi:hypothetical protein IMAU30014_00494 [Lactobacillus helveticus]|nr:hypothetical protein [Lactobacillus helveticus]
MTIWTTIFLLLGGVAGGLLSSIASMASLASYPVLLAVGIPPVFANVTNDAALIWTSIGSTVSSTKELKGHWEQVWFYTIFTVVGSIIGCMLLLSFPSSIFWNYDHCFGKTSQFKYQKAADMVKDNLFHCTFNNGRLHRLFWRCWWCNSTRAFDLYN